MEFAIVDIETTGGSPQNGGITEIAILIHDGQEITQTFSSLINPQQSIPSYITGLTGIDEDMVRDAPKFEFLVDEIWDLLSGRVFVAHQVNFDFTFLKHAFSKHGKEFSAPKLCTIRLARKIFPGLRSYSLGGICQHRGITIEDRHRAMGDAKATALLFDQMLKMEPEVIQQSLHAKRGLQFLPPHFSPARFEQIPAATGVYYMLDTHGRVVYVGKALNIQERFRGHFSGTISQAHKIKLKETVTDLTWKLTGNELMALLLEIIEIKRLWPPFNQAIKRQTALWGIYTYRDGNGYIRFQVAKKKKSIFPLELFSSREEALSYLKLNLSTYGLCARMAGLVSVPCEKAELNTCDGACMGAVSPKLYNSRAEEFMEEIKKSKLSIQVELPGRTEKERGICVFEGGILTYMGYLDHPNPVTLDQLDPVPHYPETIQIFRQFYHQFEKNQVGFLEVGHEKTSEFQLFN